MISLYAFFVALAFFACIEYELDGSDKRRNISTIVLQSIAVSLFPIINMIVAVVLVIRILKR